MEPIFGLLFEVLLHSPEKIWTYIAITVVETVHPILYYNTSNQVILGSIFLASPLWIDQRLPPPCSHNLWDSAKPRAGEGVADAPSNVLANSVQDVCSGASWIGILGGSNHQYVQHRRYLVLTCVGIYIDGL